MYRSPIDDPAEAADFYNSDYTQGFTTNLPTQAELASLKAGRWPREKDFSYYIGVLRELGLADGAKLFDFGCSWGYGSFQFRQAGFEVLSYEISRPRAAFGAEHLGVRIVDDFELWARSHPNALDAFFSAHVLEHVPSPSRIIELALSALKPGGVFVAFFPNGSAQARQAVSDWSKLWGEVHPNFLDDEFFMAAVPNRPKLFGSSPVRINAREAGYLDDMEGDEMFVAFRK
jgi:SAM-dependent methyltransferase